MTMPTVTVLLSTYNGIRYLAPLMESVLGQRDVDCHVVVRDDGSSDATRELLNSYAGQDGRIRVVAGANQGVVASFFTLMRLAPVDTRYVAFCDQDDVWEPSKLSRAVAMLGAGSDSEPAMYCSRLKIVDDDLRFLAYSDRLRRPPTFGNALVQNIATGCSVVVNRAALDMLTAHPPDTDHVIMHDWWVYLLTSALGRVVVDDQAHILYRQHSGNVVGAVRGIRAWQGRWSRFRAAGQRHPIGEQTREFVRCFRRELPPPVLELAEGMIRCTRSDRFIPRLRFAVWGGVYRQRLVDDILLKCMIASGRPHR